MNNTTTPSMITIPRDVVLHIGLHSHKPHVLITALVILVCERTSNYDNGLSVPESEYIKDKLPKDKLKKAYKRLVELGILEKKGKKLIIPWIREANHE